MATIQRFAWKFARWLYTHGFPNEMKAVILEFEGVEFRVDMDASGHADAVIRAYKEAKAKKEREEGQNAEEV